MTAAASAVDPQGHLPRGLGRRRDPRGVARERRARRRDRGEGRRPGARPARPVAAGARPRRTASTLPKVRAVTLRYVLAGEFRERPRPGRCPRASTRSPAPRTKAEEAGRARDGVAPADELRRRLRRTRRPRRGRARARDALRSPRPISARSTRSASRSASSSATARDLIADGRVRRGARRRRGARAQLLARPRRRSRGPVGGVPPDGGARPGRRGRAGRGPVGGAAAPATWVERYSAAGRLDARSTRRSGGWRRGSRSSTRTRRSAPLGVVRRAYEDACQAMADGFTKALVEGGLDRPGRRCTRRRSTRGASPSSRSPSPTSSSTPCASRWASSSPSGCRRRRRSACGLPWRRCRPSRRSAWRRCSPGAAASFAVVDAGREARARGSRTRSCRTSTARRKFAAARDPGARRPDARRAPEPGQHDEARGEGRRCAGRHRPLAGDRPRRRGRVRLPGAPGDGHRHRQPRAGDPQAGRRRRRARSCCRRDHGHLFAHGDRDESMRIDAPGRRHGRAASALLDRPRRGDAAGCVRVSAADARLRLRPRVRLPARRRRVQGRRRPRLPPRRPVAPGDGRSRCSPCAPQPAAPPRPARQSLDRHRTCPTRSPTGSSA